MQAWKVSTTQRYGALSQSRRHSVVSQGAIASGLTVMDKDKWEENEVSLGFLLGPKHQ